MKYFIYCVMLMGNTAFAEQLSLSGIIDAAEKNSNLLKEKESKVEYANAAKDLVHSYYFPVFNFTQKYIETTNPVQAFGTKLMREDFTMNDFAIDKLNNPDKTKAHISSFNIQVPVDVFGIIGTQKRSMESLKEAASYEKKWTQKEIKKMLTSMYWAYFSLQDLQKFFSDEKDFLNKILKNYDSKNSENKNRYLTYNQARIILDTLMEGVETLSNEQNKIIQNISTLTGVRDLRLLREEKKSLQTSDLSLRKQERFDLDSMNSYIGSLEEDLKKEKKSFLPEFSLFGQYNMTSEKFAKDLGKDQTIGAQLSWTLGVFTFEKNSLLQAKLRLAQYEYLNQKEKVRTDIENQKEDLEKMLKSLAHMSNRHELFQENKKILSYQYQRGSVELYNLLDNFTAYIQNYSDYMKLKAEYEAKLASYSQNFSI